MGMERSHLQNEMRLEEGTRRIILALTIRSCFGEGDLRDLFGSEEFKLMLFNFHEAGLILKEEPM
jgi:hypothetical protein